MHILCGGMIHHLVKFVHILVTQVELLQRMDGSERLELPEGSPLAFARDMFMFSFYMRGMSFVDMAFLRKRDLRYGVVTYCRKKTNQCLTIEWEKPIQTLWIVMPAR